MPATNQPGYRPVAGVPWRILNSGNRKPGCIVFEVGIGPKLIIQHGSHQDGCSEFPYRAAQVPSRVGEWIVVVIFQVVVESIGRWHRENRNTETKDRNTPGGFLSAVVTSFLKTWRPARHGTRGPIA